MLRFYFLLFAASVFFECALTALPVAAQRPGSTVTPQVDPAEWATDVFEMESTGQRTYRIFVSVPKTAPPASGFSVLYVLDGNAYFADVVQARNELPERAAPIVVGIGYPIDGRIDFARRTFDLTPDADEDNLPPRRDGEPWPTWGGADLFLEFIEDDLKPRLQQRYSIDRTQQTIFGHSFGGLFVLHALFTRPTCFQNYIASSPSVWWNDYAIEKAVSPFIEMLSQRTQKLDLVITVGELELSPDSGPAATLATTDAKRQFGTTKDFADRLKMLQTNHFSLHFQIFANASHGNVAPKAIAFGMQER